MTIATLDDAGEAPRRASGRLHAVHWIALAASVTATILVALLVDRQVDEREETAFEVEAERVVELVVDRLQQYEVGLWAGVGLIESRDDGQVLRRADWVRFAENLDLVGRYPGINGIGVIYRVGDEDVDEYVETFAPDYPELQSFGPKPEVDTDQHFPITFIEPFVGNEEAVGLDMAFEANRLAGAQAAFRSGTAQISGPIVLVQDDAQTPGFLFFAPFTGADGTEDGGGLVYAPFVARRLMEGALNVDQRDVAIAIGDGDTMLYSEHSADFAGHDPDPLFTTTSELEVYGRTWEFSVHSNQAFRTRTADNDVAIVLIAGGILNALLLGVFINNARARKRTVDYATKVTVDLRETLRALKETNQRLSLTNQDLEQFAYVASHDLQTPIRTVSNYAALLNEELEGQINDEQRGYLNSLIASSDRMREMIRSVLDYAMLNRVEETDVVDLAEIVGEVLAEVESDVADLGAQVHVGPLPRVQGSRDGLTIVFRNLIVNALKYRREEIPPELSITATSADGEASVAVSDNGVGIDPEHRAKVFELFVRLNPVNKYDGTGIGLAMCKRITESLGGRIDVAGNVAGGTTFTVVLSHAPGANHAEEPEVSADRVPRAVR
ncbi:MAG: hypothetical protein DHS20C19_08630 [Acidimicrobiales bacterium]|nr:MAG: hypothetical protein DHS20C19_08630 [Acidimicrobiales bacterium]